MSLNEERNTAAGISIAAILALLGPEATARDARHIQSIIEHTYPGVSIDAIPQETWTWVRTGQGHPPKLMTLSAHATSLMDIFLTMAPDKRSELLGIAKVLKASESSMLLPPDLAPEPGTDTSWGLKDDGYVRPVDVPL